MKALSNFSILLQFWAPGMTNGLNDQIWPHNMINCLKTLFWDPLIPPKTPLIVMYNALIFSQHLCWLIDHSKSTIVYTIQLWKSIDFLKHNFRSHFLEIFCEHFSSQPSTLIQNQSGKWLLLTCFSFGAFQKANTLEIIKSYPITWQIFW